MQRPGQMVEVEWIDSSSHHGWVPMEQSLAAREKLACLAVGYLLKDDDVGVTLAQSAAEQPGEGGDVLCALTIPRVAIVAVHRLRRS